MTRSVVRTGWHRPGIRSAGALAAAVAIAVALPAAPVAAKPPPPADNVTIDIIHVNGSGCRHGTAVVALSPDKEAFTVTYSEYLAVVGVGAGKKKDATKYCKLNLKVSAVRGYTYTVGHTDYRGIASLESGASAVLRATYFFQGTQQRPYVNHPYAGPLQDLWQATDHSESLVYGPCGKQRQFNIDTELTVSAGTSDPETTTSMIGMDSTDSTVKTTYHLIWKKCA